MSHDRASAHRTVKTRMFSAAAVIAVVLSGLGLGAMAPANADPAPMRILLTGGAAEVGRTYTATPSSDAWPEGSTLTYQWYRGDHDGDSDSFAPIDGATDATYTLTDADHWDTIQAVVRAVRDDQVVAQAHSAATNWIMYNMAPPVLSGVPHVGQTITATLGDWASEWDTTLTWRNTGVAIPGASGLTYRARPSDAGKEISLLALGEYTFANGVHPIDRYASRIRIRWATRSILRGSSPAAGRLNLTTIAYAAGASQSSVRGEVSVFDGKHRIAQFWPRGGRKTLNLRGLARGRHTITMVFAQNPWFDASQGSHTFTVR